MVPSVAVVSCCVSKPICAEIYQVRYTPLEAYREQDRVHELWQQMVTFFVQTQQDHIWQTLPYCFNNRQMEAFERLIKERAVSDVVQTSRYVL